MPRKKQQELEVIPEPEAEEQSFADLWESLPAGPVADGKYRVYKTDDGGLHVAYRAAGAETDGHYQMPGAMVGVVLGVMRGEMSLPQLVAKMMAGRFRG